MPVRRISTLLVLLFMVFQPTKATELPEGAEEVFFTLRHKRILIVYIDAVINKDKIMLPLIPLLRHLQVYHEADTLARRVEGRQPRSGRDFVVDVAGRLLQRDDALLPIQNEDMIIVRDEAYLSLSLLENLLSCSISVDYAELRLNLKTDYQLPLERTVLRKQSYGRSLENEDVSLRVPLLHDRAKAVFRGGFLNYRLQTQADNRQKGVQGNLQAKAELLGGDLFSGFSSNLQGDSLLFDGSFLWRYYLGPNSSLTQIRCGYLPTAGLTSGNMLGVELNNDPLRLPHHFSESELTSSLLFNWDAELYINNRLVEVRQGDSSTRVNFSVPLSFGSSSILLKKYGPMDQYEEEQLRIVVPRSFRRPGDFAYHLRGGVISSSGSPLFEGGLAFGINRELTVEVNGSQYFHKYEGRSLVTGLLHGRLGESILSSLSIEPARAYGISLSASIGARSRLKTKVDYTPRGTSLAPTQRGNLAFDLRLPGRFFGKAFDLSVDGQLQRFKSGLLRSKLQSNLRFALAGAAVDSRWRYDETRTGSYMVSQNFRGDLSLRYPLRMDWLPDILKGIDVEAAAGYHFTEQILSGCVLGMTRKFMFATTRCDIGVRYDVLRGQTQAQLRLSHNLPFTRIRSALRRDRQHYRGEMSLEGSVALDELSRSLVFSSKAMRGAAALSVRVFIDSNANGRFDEGETIIDNPALSIGQSVTLERDESGIVRILNLLPYTEYIVRLDCSALPNPLLTPRHAAFAVITDPHRIKAIDIPLLQGGIVEGRISLQSAAGIRPGAGLRLRITDNEGQIIKETLSFSDGSFYLMGVPPGDFTALIDPAQLELLEIKQGAEPVAFSVRQSLEGDLVSGIDLHLVQ